MKHVSLAAIIIAACSPALAAEVGVAIGISQPGFYGQISIGELPRPRLIYAQPVVVRRVPAVAVAEPIYLHVPPGHEKHWRRHCAEYDACGRSVYFVREDWYQKEYVPRHRHDAGEDRGDHPHHDEGHGHGHDKGHGHDDRDE
jgi:hypothetical protein